MLSYSSALDIEKIQGEFFTDVVLKPLYLKYHYTQMEDNNIQEDEALKKALKRRAHIFSITSNYWQKAQIHLNTIKEKLTKSQYVTLIDLSKQVLIVTLWDKSVERFYPIGYDFISSGDIDKEEDVAKGEDHYLKTPAGLFEIESGWRSEGKRLSDNYSLPYGKKGRFIYFFGKHQSIRYNTFDENGEKIKDPSQWKLITDELNFAIHAHKSTASFGVTNSHGCIRMQEPLNVFMDNNLVLSEKFIDQNKRWIHKSANPPANPTRYDLAGKYMLIVDEI